MRPFYFHLCHRALWQLHTHVCQRASSALSFSSQSTSPAVATYHLQRALPGGIVLMELAFQVRKNKKQSMISGGSSGTVFRGDKGSDEECSRVHAETCDSSFVLSCFFHGPARMGSAGDDSAGLRAVRVAWGRIMKSSAAVRVLCAQPHVGWSGLVQTRDETEHGVRVSGPQPKHEVWGLCSFPGEAQGCAVLCCAHVLFPPGLLLLCEAICAGVLTHPHGPVRELSGNGFAGTAGAP